MSERTIEVQLFLGLRFQRCQIILAYETNCVIGNNYVKSISEIKCRLHCGNNVIQICTSLVTWNKITLTLLFIIEDILLL